MAGKAAGRTHALLVHASDTMRRRTVVDWVSRALDSGDKVLYQISYDENVLDPMDHWIAGPGGTLGATGAIATGQLEMLDAREMSAQAGGKAVGLHQVQLAQVRRAIGESYTRVTMTSEHAALHVLAPDPSELRAHERQLDRLIETWPVRALCQYGVAGEDPTLLEAMAAVHWAHITDASWSVSARDGVWHLAGVLDSGDLGRFAAAVDELVLRTSQEEPGAGVRIDLSGVRFIDVDAVRLLVEAAARLPGPGRMVLRSPSSVVRRLVERLDRGIRITLASPP
jgi:anti-anti-sigma regulatory factor